MQINFHRILVGADGSEESRAAIDAAIAIAKKFNAELHCIGVITPMNPETEAEGVGLEQFEQSHTSIRDQVFSCRDQAHSEGVQTTTELLHGEPESEIEKYAIKRAIDLIVVGHHHVNRLRSFLEGSTSRDLIERASFSVLVISPGLSGNI